MLEDFDRFAHRTAKRQSVLYNILDFINTPGVQVQPPADVRRRPALVVSLLPCKTLPDTRPLPCMVRRSGIGCTLSG